MSAVAVRVPAKINLSLNVGPVRADGFHELDTVFCAVSLYDHVRAEASPELSVTIEGPYARGVPLDDQNLAVQAVRLLAEHLGQVPDVALHLRKGIPVAGGMAGGSADAAGALVAAALLWTGEAPFETLAPLAARLGSDVPFSLLGGAAAGAGRGEVLTPVEAGATFWWVVAKVSGGLSTPAVYAEYDRAHGDRAQSFPGSAAGSSAAVVAALRSGDPAQLGAVVSNDLQDAACRLRPELRGTLAYGRAASALAAMVSGSGPTCLFLAGDQRHAGALADAIGQAPLVEAVEIACGPVAGPREEWTVHGS